MESRGSPPDEVVVEQRLQHQLVRPIGLVQGEGVPSLRRHVRREVGVGQLIEEEIDCDDLTDARRVVLEDPSVPDVEQPRCPRDLARDRLSDELVGVELGRVPPVLFSGEELGVLAGAGRILAAHVAGSLDASL